MIGPLLIVLCALLWGTAFVAQKTSAAHLGPFAILALRSVLATLFLFLCTKLARGRGFTRQVWIGGGLGGFALFCAQLVQQIGIGSTTPGVAAFLTANYILFVPLLGFVLGQRIRPAVAVGVLVALAGSYLICISGGGERFHVGTGELWLLLCAALFAVQIILVDRFAGASDVWAFSCVQQLVCTIVALPFLLLDSERIHLTIPDLTASCGAILYLGIVSSGIAYTLQNFGQTRTPPAVAAILFSLESVFGALAGYLLLGDLLSSRQICGCALVFLASLSVALTPAPKK